MQQRIVRAGLCREPRMARVGAIRIGLFLALTACVALCQQPKERAFSNSLPNAPLPQAHTAVGAVAVTFTGTNSAAQSDALQSRGMWKTDDPSLRLDSAYEYEEQPKDSDQFRRELVSLLQHRATYQPSSENGLMARAVSAALGTFFRRDASGQTRLKTSYVLGVLTSAVIHTAYRPYWNRPVSAPFSDFGSTVGNDAGMNLLHEFRPSLEQLMKSHTPKFVSRIEASFESK